MSTVEQSGAGRFPLRVAMEARDLPAALDAFAPDAVFRSPFTGLLAFAGRDQIGAVVAVVLDVFEDLRYTDQLREGDRGVLVAQATVGGKEIELVDYLRFDADGKIQQMTVFFRPLPASAVALRLIGAGLARRRSRLRAGAISALARPLAVMTGAGDRLGVRLVRPSP